MVCQRRFVRCDRCGVCSALSLATSMIRRNQCATVFAKSHRADMCMVIGASSGQRLCFSARNGMVWWNYMNTAEASRGRSSWRGLYWKLSGHAWELLTHSYPSSHVKQHKPRQDKKISRLERLSFSSCRGLSRFMWLEGYGCSEELRERRGWTYRRIRGSGAETERRFDEPHSGPAEFNVMARTFLIQRSWLLVFLGETHWAGVLLSFCLRRQKSWELVERKNC